MQQQTPPPSWRSALPFWISLLLIPIFWIGATQGGWLVLLLPISTWYLFSIIDGILGLDTSNVDPETDRSALKWHQRITLVWAPIQFLTLFSGIAYIAMADHLNGWEVTGLFIGMGVLTGTIGINYSHELMHQRTPLEKWSADILLAMVLYSHFRSEHLLVHHRYVATPKDPVTARYGEGFYRFFVRVLRQSPVSAFRAEAQMLQRKNLPWADKSNPFWRYGALQLAFVILAALVGGWFGVLFFCAQAFVAVLQLELVNYVEHYGLTRKHLGNGKYEHVQPRHSWNAAHRASNWLLINLQRHSDHHYKPDRPFPLLQTYDDSAAPNLPFGYPIMTMMAMSPTLWRKFMNPRVSRWRDMYYPEINDWTPYNKHSTPMPK